MQQSVNSDEESADTIRESMTNLHEDLAEILRLISKAEPLDTILQRVASVISSRFAIKSLTICLFDDGAGYYRPVVVRGFAEDQARAIGKHAYSLERKQDELCEKFRMARDCYYVRAEGLTHVYNDDVDYLNDPEDASASNGSDEWHDLDYIDLLMRDRLGNLIGWIEIDEPENRQALPPDVIDRLRLVSDITAIAVEHSKICEDAIAAIGESQGHLDLIVHDIGNLMDPLSHYLEAAKTEAQSGRDPVQSLEKAVALSADARALVRNVRKLNEARTGSPSAKRSFDLKPVLVRCISSVKMDFPGKDVVIDFDFPDEECPVMADELIADLFSNILGNAVKHTRSSEAEVNMAISNGHDSWIVRIEDHGVGIPDSQKESAFARFTRRGGGAGGTGLGLSIVGLLVSRYNGLVTLKDRVPGDHTQGTVFEVALPKAERS